MEVVRVFDTEERLLGEFSAGESAAAIIELFRESKGAISLQRRGSALLLLTVKLTPGDYILGSSLSRGIQNPQGTAPKITFQKRGLIIFTVAHANFHPHPHAAGFEPPRNERHDERTLMEVVLPARSRWTPDLVRRLREATHNNFSSVQGRLEPDWISIKEKFFQDVAMNPSQLRWKWNRLRDVNFELAEQENQLEIDERLACTECAAHAQRQAVATLTEAEPEASNKRRRGRYTPDSCGWCVCKHRACLPQCPGRAHFPRQIYIPSDLLRMHSLNTVIKIVHLGLRNNDDFERLPEEARDVIRQLQVATGTRTSTLQIHAL